MFFVRLWFRALGVLAHVLAIFVRRLTSDRAPMAGEMHVDTAWLTRQLQTAKLIGKEQRVASAVLNDIEANRGLASVVHRVRVTLGDGAALELILKRSFDSVDGRKNVIVGCWWREAKFLTSDLALDETVAPYTRSVVAASGSALLGEFAILMRDVTKAPFECGGLNYLYGNQIWGHNGRKLSDAAILNTLERVWLAAAPMHAKFFNDRALLDQQWLRGAPWLVGAGRLRWELSLDTTRRAWQTALPKLAAIGIEPRFIALMTRSIEQSSFDEFQLHIRNAPFTLTHGDFHASNMMISATSLQMLDWSEVGLCEPAADVGQTVISDIPHTLYDRLEPALRKYHAVLAAEHDYPWVQFRADFASATISRWVFMFALLTDFPLPPALMLYFQTNMLTFIQLYGDINGTYPLRHMVSIMRIVD